MEDASALDLCFGEWVEALLERLFTLFANLDSQPTHAAADGHAGPQDTDVSFLMYGQSMYRPFMELLFARLSPVLYDLALQRVTRFLTTHTVAGAVSEMGVLVAAVVWANPPKATAGLLSPLHTLLSAELDAVLRTVAENKSLADGGGKGKGELLSAGQEAAFKWWIGLFTSTLHYAATEAVTHKAQLLEMVAKLFTIAEATRSLSMGEAASQMLSSLLGTLVFYYPMDEYAAQRPADAMAAADVDQLPERWVAGGRVADVGDAAPVVWHVPTRDEVAMAEQLLDTYLEAPVKTLLAMCSTGGDTPMATGNGNGEERKQQIRIQLLMLEGALGVRSALADFGGEQQAAKCPWLLVGAVGAAVGREGARSRVGEALHALVATEPAGDPETLLLVMRVLDSVMGCGRREFSDWQQSMQAWRVDAHYLTQPKLAVLAPTLGDAMDEGAGVRQLPSPLSRTSSNTFALGPLGPSVACCWWVVTHPQKALWSCQVGGAAVARREAAWRGRCLMARPRWLVVERSFLTVQWRASQVQYFAGKWREKG